MTCNHSGCQLLSYCMYEYAVEARTRTPLLTHDDMKWKMQHNSRPSTPKGNRAITTNVLGYVDANGKVSTLPDISLNIPLNKTQIEYLNGLKLPQRRWQNTVTHLVLYQRVARLLMTYKNIQGMTPYYIREKFLVSKEGCDRICGHLVEKGVLKLTQGICNELYTYVLVSRDEVGKIFWNES